jgi:surface antigen
MLAMVGVVLGSLAVTSVAMGQSAQSAAQQNALRATTSQATVTAQPAVARQPAQAARAATPTAPRAAIAPQGQAQAALLTPVVARAPLVGAGTPILPVAQTSGLSCVPFVRMATGMNISGDARMWWHNAAGAYARGQTPERGSVLAFMSSGGMARGHVAVVSRVVNPRTVQVDHANWAGPGIRRGSVMRGVTVVDVSDRNDWTSVRVQVGHGAENFGRTYPTHGFIYNRPTGSGLMMAGGTPMNEVAEAPSPHAALHLRFALETLAE